MTIDLNLNVTLKWADWPEMKGILVDAQQKLDAIAAAITKGVTDLTAAIAALKQQAPTLDFSGVDAAVKSLSDLDAANPPPATP